MARKSTGFVAAKIRAHTRAKQNKGRKAKQNPLGSGYLPTAPVAGRYSTTATAYPNPLGSGYIPQAPIAGRYSTTATAYRNPASRNPRDHYESFVAELRPILRSRRHPRHASLLRRVAGERKLLVFGNSVGWDREAIIQWCLRPESPSGWLGRKVFEQSFDDGSMKYMAEWYDKLAREYGY